MLLPAPSPGFSTKGMEVFLTTVLLEVFQAIFHAFVLFFPTYCVSLVSPLYRGRYVFSEITSAHCITKMDLWSEYRCLHRELKAFVLIT